MDLTELWTFTQIFNSKKTKDMKQGINHESQNKLMRKLIPIQVSFFSSICNSQLRFQTLIHSVRIHRH